jgi:hypothetical protein
MRKVQYYYDILASLQQALPHKIHIAGGAVRDTILGRPIRDIDIFTQATTGDEAAALLRSDFGYVKVEERGTYLGFSDPIVVRVAKFEKDGEFIPVSLIGLKESLTIEENIKRFDFGICMAAWDGGEFKTTDAFKRDVGRRTFTLCRAANDAQFSYSMNRYSKLTADRYNGWTLSVPNQFEDLAKEHAFRKHWYRAHEGDHFGFESHPQVLQPKER